MTGRLIYSSTCAASGDRAWDVSRIIAACSPPPENSQANRRSIIGFLPAEAAIERCYGYDPRHTVCRLRRKGRRSDGGPILMFKPPIGSLTHCLRQLRGRKGAESAISQFLETNVESLPRNLPTFAPQLFQEPVGADRRIAAMNQSVTASVPANLRQRKRDGSVRAISSRARRIGSTSETRRCFPNHL